MKKYFGTDGIRGKAFEFLSLKLAYKIGVALKFLNKDEVVIGYDTRQSSLALFNALSNGVINSNMKVINAGVITTPGLCLYSKEKNIVGVMITASHNPYYDNGIKIFLNGYKLTIKQELALEEIINNHKEEIKIIDLDIKEQFEVKEFYTTFLRNVFNDYLELKVAIDCANGASSFISSDVFENVALDIKIVNNQPDGKNINEKCGAIYPQVIADIVKESSFDIGFSFDGDADRLAVVDNLGNIYRGDELTYIFAKYLKDNNQLKDNTVILTPMSNLGLMNSLKQIGIKVQMVDVGDKNIVHSMIKDDYSYGSEDAGHIVFGDILRTGDAMLTSLMTLKVLKETSLTLKELTNDLTMYPILLRNIKNINKNKIKDEKVIKLVNDINESLKNEGILIVRASGTEDLIRISCCAKDENLVNKHIDDVTKLINGL